MCIPDPIELMEARIERLSDQWDQAQRDVPVGSFRCPYCSGVFDYEPIQSGSSPDSPAMCYDCLPEEIKTAYDKFCGETMSEVIGEEDEELEYLRWFYSNADFGPADCDVRSHLNDRFMRETGKDLPQGYGDEE